MTTPVGAVAGNARQVQADAARREPASGGFFSKKYGPLPGWGWAALAGVGAIGYFWWRNRSAAAAAGTAAASAGTGASGTGSDVSPADIATLQSEVEQLQGALATEDNSSTSSPDGGQDRRQERRQDRRQEARKDARQESRQDAEGRQDTRQDRRQDRRQEAREDKESVPGGLHVVRDGSTAVSVRWNKVQGADRYRVSRDGKTGITVPGASDRYVFSGLRGGTHHTWQVEAHTRDGWSPPASSQFTTRKSVRRETPR